MSLMLGTNKIASKNVTGDTLPVGVISEWPTNTAPENWLICDGSAISRTTYSALYAVIGTTYGAGDGSTTFNIPNYKGRIPVGRDSSQTEFDTLAETGGEKTHTLTINEMPSHDHYANYGSTAGGDGSGFVYSSTLGNGDIFILNTGGGQAHNNIQPYIVQNYIIKAFQSSGTVATVVDNVTSTSATNALSANQGKVLGDRVSVIENKLRTYVSISTTDLTTTNDTVVATYTIPSSVVGTIKVLILYTVDMNFGGNAPNGTNICINVGGTDRQRQYGPNPTSSTMWGTSISTFDMVDVTANTVIQFKAQKDNSNVTTSVINRSHASIIQL